ncbi:MAG TPA: hypothetical protein VMS55_19915 [Myxococcota bacterium]|nr:hypothetical protein [Myxococcota bacterium]
MHAARVWRFPQQVDVGPARGKMGLASPDDRTDWQPDQWVTLAAQLDTPGATPQLAHFHLPEPVDAIVPDREEDGYRIDLCLTLRPPSTRACYRERWGPCRFDRMGDLYVLPPGETLRVRSERGRQYSILCHLRPEALHVGFDREPRWAPRRLEATLDVRNASIRNLMLRLAEEARDPGFGSQMLVELIAMQLAIELSRHCARIAEGPATGGLAPWRLRVIDERLREVCSAPSLAELAGLCKLSVRQLTRGFRASRGCSIGDYVASSQIDHARRLPATHRSIKVHRRLTRVLLAVQVRSRIPPRHRQVTPRAPAAAPASVTPRSGPAFESQLGVLSILVAGSASAKVMDTWTRISIQFTNLARAEATDTGIGVTTLTTAASGDHLNTLSLGTGTQGGIPGLSLNTVLPVTDPLVSNGGIVSVRLEGVRQGFVPGPNHNLGVLGPVSGAIESTSTPAVASAPSPRRAGRASACSCPAAPATCRSTSGRRSTAWRSASASAAS